MANVVDYKPIANSGGANVESQAQFLIDIGAGGTLVNGFIAGLAKSNQANKVFRQTSMMAAAMATFISNTLTIDVLDDGVLATLVTNFTNAIKAVGTLLPLNNVWTGSNIWTKQISAPHIPLGNTGAVLIPDFSLGVNFTCTATANFTLSNPINTTDGQAGSIQIIQDGTGSRVITWGSKFLFPGGIKPVLSTAVGARDRLSYIVDFDGQIDCTLTKQHS
jgi:hypothetical protein